MKSTILTLSAQRWLTPLLVLSLIVLWRGHHLPGGGFIAGLLASSGFVLISLADGVPQARQRLVLQPMTFLVLGLNLAWIAAILPMFVQQPMLTGLWLKAFSLPFLGTIHLGTPLLFDVGVYFSVMGFTLTVTFSLEDPNT
jgi:multicomponent Na+:H+ antiporter subunit B